MADKAESTQSAPSSGGRQKQEKDPRKRGRDLALDPDQYVTEGSEESLEKGYWGTRDTPFDDEEFALTTGPNSPGEADLADPDNYDGSKTVTQKDE